MSAFLEAKLKRESGESSKTLFKVPNSTGVIRGSKETAKGKRMEKKHVAKVGGGQDKMRSLSDLA